MAQRQMLKKLGGSILPLATLNVLWYLFTVFRLERLVMTEFRTYGKSKPPDPQKLTVDILAILRRKDKGELPFVSATSLRQRVCGKVTAPTFFAFLKEMEQEELIMVSGTDAWAQCALWDHPRMIQWRIEREKWAAESAEYERRRQEERRQWEIENAPRLARERFQHELGEFFADNADDLLASVKNLFRAHRSRKRTWLFSRNYSSFF
jgi:hypothetical protein